MPQFRIKIRISAYITNGQRQHILANAKHFRLKLLTCMIFFPHISKIGIAHCLLAHCHIKSAGSYRNACRSAGQHRCGYHIALGNMLYIQRVPPLLLQSE